MAGTVDFYFDFASPYAYFSYGEIEGIARDHGREVVLRPVLLWAVRKHFDMKPPLEDGPKAQYMPLDMARSAAFHGLPFRIPDSFGRSTHLAARLFYGIAATHPHLQGAYAKAIFGAHFADNRDIADPQVLADVASAVGIAPEESSTLATADASRGALEAANRQAIDNGVWGSPFFLLDGEGFFGADRLPQLRWRLSQLSNQGVGT